MLCSTNFSNRLAMMHALHFSSFHITSRSKSVAWFLMALVVRQSQSFVTEETIVVLRFPVVLRKNSRLLEQTFFVVLLSDFSAYAMFIRCHRKYNGFGIHLASRDNSLPQIPIDLIFFRIRRIQTRKNKNFR